MEDSTHTRAQLQGVAAVVLRVQLFRSLAITLNTCALHLRLLAPVRYTTGVAQGLPRIRSVRASPLPALSTCLCLAGGASNARGRHIGEQWHEHRHAQPLLQTVIFFVHIVGAWRGCRACPGRRWPDEGFDRSEAFCCGRSYGTHAGSTHGAASHHRLSSSGIGCSTTGDSIIRWSRVKLPDGAWLWVLRPADGASGGG